MVQVNEDSISIAQFYLCPKREPYMYSMYSMEQNQGQQQAQTQQQQQRQQRQQQQQQQQQQQLHIPTVKLILVSTGLVSTVGGQVVQST